MDAKLIIFLTTVNQSIKSDEVLQGIFLDPLEKCKHSGKNFVVATIDCSFVATLFGNNLLQKISSIYKKNIVTNKEN